MAKIVVTRHNESNAPRNSTSYVAVCRSEHVQSSAQIHGGEAASGILWSGLDMSSPCAYARWRKSSRACLRSVCCQASSHEPLPPAPPPPWILSPSSPPCMGKDLSSCVPDTSVHASVYRVPVLVGVRRTISIHVFYAQRHLLLDRRCRPTQTRGDLSRSSSFAAATPRPIKGAFPRRLKGGSAPIKGGFRAD